VATPVEITRRLAAAIAPLGEDEICALCGVQMPSPATDGRDDEELAETPDWHADGCPWAEAVLWDAYHPESEED
jgi:hypothetical protein